VALSSECALVQDAAPGGVQGNTRGLDSNMLEYYEQIDSLNSQFCCIAARNMATIVKYADN